MSDGDGHSIVNLFGCLFAVCMCEGDGALTGCTSVLMYMCEWVGGGGGERERRVGYEREKGQYETKKGPKSFFFFLPQVLITVTYTLHFYSPSTQI